jgi:hypothetical protein
MNNGPKEAEVIAAAQEAVDFAKQHFQLTLDYSDKSIQEVEGILARFHDDLPKSAFQRLFRPAPPPEKISQTVVMFGSYVGEVLHRRLSGSRWEQDTSGGRNVLCLTDGERRVWPHTKVHKRIINGPEDNIWHYFTGVIEHWSQKD